MIGIRILDSCIDTLLVFLFEESEAEVGYFLPVSRDQRDLCLVGGVFFDFLVTHFN